MGSLFPVLTMTDLNKKPNQAINQGDELSLA